VPQENISVAKLLGEHQKNAKESLAEIARLLELAANMSPKEADDLLAQIRVVTNYAEVLQAIGAGKLPPNQKS
jgi:hypothetical protein